MNYWICPSCGGQHRNYHKAQTCKNCQTERITYSFRNDKDNVTKTDKSVTKEDDQTKEKNLCFWRCADCGAFNNMENILCHSCHSYYNVNDMESIFCHSCHNVSETNAKPTIDKENTMTQDVDNEDRSVITVGGFEFDEELTKKLQANDDVVWALQHIARNGAISFEVDRSSTLSDIVRLLKKASEEGYFVYCAVDYTHIFIMEDEFKINFDKRE